MRNLKNPSNRNFKHVIVYVHKEFGALKKFCEGCRSKMLIFSFSGVKELPEWLKMQTNTRRQRQANRKDDRDVQQEEEEKAKRETSTGGNETTVKEGTNANGTYCGWLSKIYSNEGIFK